MGLRLRSVLATAVFALLAVPQSLGEVNNIVTQWNAILRTSLSNYNLRHQVGIRYFALLHISQVKALTKNNNAHHNHPVPLVAATASHYVLSTLLPDQQSAFYDGLLATHLAGYSNAQYKSALELAKPIIVHLLSDRSNDGSQIFFNFTAAPANSTPPAYQLTPGQTFFLYPQLGDTEPFWNTPATKIIFKNLYKPDDIKSPQFVADLEEVYSVGGKGTPDSTNSTRDTADFWADGAGTSQHGGHWNAIAIQLLPGNLSSDLWHTARLLATVNTLAYDANILTWYIKFQTAKFWRPVTAIRQGYSNFTADVSWTPYLSTPQHTEYPSGHSTTAGAFGAFLRWYLGTDTINAAISTEGKSQTGATLPPRNYTSIQQIVVEVGLSRVYGGLHFRKSVNDGAALAWLSVYSALGRAYYSLGL